MSSPLLTRSRVPLRAVAILSCLPYLGLKTAWLTGSDIGIPEGSVLLEHRGAVAVANGVTLLMDACVIVLALLLTRPWGLRVPAWLLVGPVWVATGLLSPIMAGFPLQLLLGSGEDSGSEPFLHDWVFSVVYGGFIVQGLALGALFVLYTRERWGHVWQGRMWEVPGACFGTWPRTATLFAAAASVVPLAVHLRSACDGEWLRALDVLFLLAGVAGAVVLAFRRVPVLPVRVPLALAWLGSGAAACWGAWLTVASVVTADHPTGPLYLAYAGQMITGSLVAAVGVHFLGRRSV
ncbi:hypothetical protein QNN03_09865 [Streptomyces sp. GXMU-J15]|uniref:Aromatic ring-opening dioxygenase LigA n=1 Tax=Streptomyces fuscus TaxID=3048495 RepID=A0ABT7IVY9_9ACTN|nr:hypothetical protein [Streptomyces fuscus]MDL2076741.1 hypothetical protein [Streptomyces fuscus]